MVFFFGGLLISIGLFFLFFWGLVESFFILSLCFFGDSCELPPFLGIFWVGLFPWLFGRSFGFFSSFFCGPSVCTLVASWWVFWECSCVEIPLKGRCVC